MNAAPEGSSGENAPKELANITFESFSGVLHAQAAKLSKVLCDMQQQKVKHKELTPGSAEEHREANLMTLNYHNGRIDAIVTEVLKIQGLLLEKTSVRGYPSSAGGAGVDGGAEELEPAAAPLAVDIGQASKSDGATWKDDKASWTKGWVEHDPSKWISPELWAAFDANDPATWAPFGRVDYDVEPSELEVDGVLDMVKRGFNIDV
ncbi:unnamed protein product [Prorocentrum cordatum]|uniref:Mediator complex subunit 11 n=1 Tax=Prorocentrum cordatum TaxID=2364126 RepID=A0ABN9QB74_9DINO|nr:unnamed protein product [Polarella glacialis]